MEKFSEIVEFIVAHKDLDEYPAHTIIELAMDEFNTLMQDQNKHEYFGLQQDGKYKIHVTYYSPKQGLKLGALIWLDEDV